MLLTVFWFCIFSKSNAQNQSISKLSERKNPAIGLHYSISNFSNTPCSLSELNSGYMLSFLDGIKGKYDYMIQAGSISPKYNFSKTQNNNKDLLHFLSINCIRRFFADTVLINPFISAGPGVAMYNEQAIATFSAGAGFQLRISPKILLHTQLNYQFSSSSSVNNNTSASIGLLGTILQRKKKNNSRSNVLSNTIQPLLDTDGDGIPDIQDDCPTIPGPKIYNGCADTDGDGIPDNKDKCPTVPGYIEYEGCPAPIVHKDSVTKKNQNVDDNSRKLSDSITTKIDSIATKIFFEVNKAVLKPSSQQPLNEIVSILKQNQIFRLSIIGHTDNTGTEKRNQELSLQRALVVKEYLVKQGINVGRLQAAGAGSTQPIADNNTVEGRSKNRRTEFKLSL